MRRDAYNAFTDATGGKDVPVKIYTSMLAQLLDQTTMEKQNRELVVEMVVDQIKSGDGQ